LITPLFFALAFHNEIQYRYLNEYTNSGNNPSTSDVNSVGFCLVTLEFTCSTVYSKHWSALGLVYPCLVGSSTARHYVNQYAIFVSLLFAMAQHCYARQAKCYRLCHAF